MRRVSQSRLYLACALVVLGFLSMPGKAYAACSTPAGTEGEMIYSTDYKVMEYCDGTNWIGMYGNSGSGGAGVTDGNKGDLTVSGSGATWTINSASVQYSKIQNVTSGALLGRYAATGGSVQEITLGSGLTLNTTTGVLTAAGAGSNGTAGYVQFSGGSGAFASDSTAGGQFFWDTTNHRLGIGTTSPAQALDVNGKVTSNSLLLKIVSGAAAPSSGYGSSGGFNGMIAAFAASSCPSGWTEYTAARGRFLRGIDSTGTLDPDGVRAPGSLQADMLKSHTHTESTFGNVAPNAFWINSGGAYGNNYQTTTGATGGSETRPVNVAVIFCQYTWSGGGGGGSASASGSQGYVQFAGASNAFASDSLLFWDATNHRLGIGTATPQSVLHVGGRIQTDATGDGAELLFSKSGTTNEWSLQKIESDSTGRLRFYDYVNSKERLTLLNNGNVGIGTANPTAALQLEGTAPSIVFSRSNVTESMIMNYSDGNVYYDYKNNFYFRNGINGVGSTSPLTLTSAGKVGIGIIGPSQTLDVNGPVEIRGSAGSSSLIGGRLNSSSNFHIDAYNPGSGTRGIYLNYFTGTGVYLAGGAAVTSDARKKKDIQTLPNALEKITALRGVSFHWRDPKRDQKTQIGVIAQEVKKVYPELVKDDGYGYLAVDYGGFAGPLIEAVKQLKSDNDDLRKIVEQQGREIEALKAAH